MSGLRKAKKYDWKDSNLAMFGSDLEKNVKKESAEGEPAWEGAGQDVGLQIWRIVKFKVTHWPKEDYGMFYTGDSYIILNTYKEPDKDELFHDVHFWIGKESTQDEYGTAAYKTVELDNFLDGKPVQHREVQGHESKLFKSYFKNFTTIKGGADTGFKRVRPEAYKTRLIVLNSCGSRFEQTEKKLKMGNMKNDTVVIIDSGYEIIQWNGKLASKKEVFSGTVFANRLKSERNGKPTITVLDDQTVEDLHPKLAAVIKDDSPKKQKGPREPVEKALSRLSDDSGVLEIATISSGDEVDRSQLKSEDVFVFETDGHCYVWCGNKASIDERRKCMMYAHHYMMKSSQPLACISCIREGAETQEFLQAINN